VGGVVPIPSGRAGSAAAWQRMIEFFKKNLKG
jgi:hypothetical protein